MHTGRVALRLDLRPDLTWPGQGRAGQGIQHPSVLADPGTYVIALYVKINNGTA